MRELLNPIPEVDLTNLLSQYREFLSATIAITKMCEEFRTFFQTF